MLLTADYNLDGKVNAADYTLWRDTLGQSVPPGTGADGNGDGMITAADYDLWKSNYTPMPGVGNGAGLSSISVPEPCGWMLLLTLLLPGGCRGAFSRKREFFRKFSSSV
jgi:hypothetical protein